MNNNNTLFLCLFYISSNLMKRFIFIFLFSLGLFVIFKDKLHFSTVFFCFSFNLN
jgi:hypothetical protein